MQTTPNRPALPEEIQSAINAANVKINVLREEETKLSKEKASLEKEVARVQIEQELLEKSLPEFAQKALDAQNKLKDINFSIEEATLKLKELKDEYVKENKALDEVRQISKSEAEKCSQTVQKGKEVEADIEAKKANLQAKVDIFENRKKQVQELLTSI